MGTALAIALAVPAASANAETLRADETQARACDEALLDASETGIARSEWIAPGRGIATFSLRGGLEPDWDLALFRGGRAIAASSSFTSRESAATWVRQGERLEVQACRRAGPRPAVELEVSLYETKRPSGPEQRISLESVTIESRSELARLEGLGLDVTHAAGPDTATVALYSDAERAQLMRKGFDSLPLIRDLAAADEADRAAEALAAATGPRSALPSARESYRVYEDYTAEMKALSTQNPGLVRSIVIGSTFEGRPIEGVEIATGVSRTDDGRPVYLNFGGHHAREWPASELPMEFALDLVQRFNSGDARVQTLLENVRVVVVPVVNVDGFIASRSYGFNPATDNDSDLTLSQAFANQAAYIRKNCRPTDPAQAATPCAQRSFSGVDLNRNYGAYWGGPGSSSDTTSQAYRGTGPFSEPESEAVHQFTAGLHPTVFITNHTFTEGRWLRQPGFDADFLAQVEVPTYREACAKNPDDDGVPPDDPGAIAPDEAAMKDLGDDMAAANGWISELGYETLCDITGATEDWNYFAQGTYGYTPEVRGPNFHADYAEMVVGEYVGGTAENPLGIGESYLIAGERAADEADHSVIEGTAPPGATLRLRKEFDTPTCESATCPQGNGTPIRDVLETTLIVPADGTYEWDVNPSGRPLHPGETYTMICEQSKDGGGLVSREVGVARGSRVTQDFERCGPPLASFGKCAGKTATIAGTGKADRPLRGTTGRDVILALRGNDVIRGRGGNDLICAGGGKDKLRGGTGKDKLRAGGGKDRIDGGPGRDRCRGGAGKDRLRRCP